MSTKFYQGIFRPTNPGKYKGDPTKIAYRSSWEKQVLKWLDTNPDITEYSSEEVVVPYICPTDGRGHRYFVDLLVKFKTGKSYLIEIKPRKETIEPKPGKRKSPRYIREVLTYVKNRAKWEAANEFALDRGWEFQVWTEQTLKGLGIRILT